MNHPSRIWLGFALSCAAAGCAFGASLDSVALIGKWEYTSYTMVQNGKPSGTAHFSPGTMAFTYRGDGTWEMQAADPNRTHLTGTYKIRKNELIMKKADGSLYQDFEVQMSDDRNAMTLRDKRSIVTATKIATYD